jgi:DNA invertase Pin-like site-specific DNA recombinase
MPKFRPAQKTDGYQWDSSVRLKIHEPVAVYYRQSTIAQVGNYSTGFQQVDIPAMLINAGWDKSLIYLVDADSGVSGSTAIDERIGMSEVYRWIEEGRIGTVAVADEDRLFRDVTQIQVNVFAKACKDNGVQIWTPTMLYDFAHPSIGQWHLKQFRYKSEMSAEYLTSQIKNRLQANRNRAAMAGMWASGRPPFGYMIDDRKSVSGIPNPQYRRLVPFEPQADRLREWYHLYEHEFDFNIRELARQIIPRKLGVPSDEPPPGYITNIFGGQFPGHVSMREKFTNPASIGWHMWQGRPVIKNNHEPIIAEDAFWRVFLRLSTTMPDGSRNENKTERRLYLQPKERPYTPVLTGMMFDEQTGHRIGVRFKENTVVYVLNSSNPFKPIVWARKCKMFDEAIFACVYDKLKESFSSPIWEEEARRVAQAAEESKFTTAKAIARVESEIQAMENSLSMLKTKQLIQKLEERYAEAQKTLERLQSKAAKIEHEGISIRQQEQIREALRPTIDVWHTLDHKDKGRVVSHAVHQIHVSSLENRESEAHVRITWSDKTETRIIVYTRFPRGTAWSERESQNMAVMLGQRLPWQTWLETFPGRTWQAICSHAKWKFNRRIELSDRGGPGDTKFGETATYVYEFESDVSRPFEPILLAILSSALQNHREASPKESSNKHRSHAYPMTRFPELAPCVAG